MVPLGQMFIQELHHHRVKFRIVSRDSHILLQEVEKLWEAVDSGNVTQVLFGCGSSSCPESLIFIQSIPTSTVTLVDYEHYPPPLVWAAWLH